MSANAPILQLILEKLTTIEKDVAELKKDVAELKKDVAQLKTSVSVLQQYNQNSAKIQEQEFTNQLKTHLIEKHKDAIIQTVVFGNFYKVNSNDPLTDLDGCILANVPLHTFKKNGKNIRIDRSCFYILEAKHAITKALLDKKIKQFVHIINAIQYVKSAGYNPAKKTMFDKMVDLHKLKQLPENICFLMSTEKIAPDALQILIRITTGSLTEEIYNDLLFENVYNHDLIKDIINDESVDAYVKESLQKIKSITDVYAIVNPIAPNKSEKKSQHDLYKKKETILPYRHRILNLMTPYEEYVRIIDILIGKLGFISKTEIQLPEDVMRDGFNSKNRLLTASQQNYIKSRNDFN